MKQVEFYRRVCNSEFDIISKFLEILEKEGISYCVIGGVGVNAYCEPLVTLDFDCIVSSSQVEKLKEILKKEGFKVKSHPHTWEITHKASDIRIQLQRDERYQEFIDKAKLRQVLGYKIKVAKKTDLLKGKLWAYEDKTRDAIKRDKDLLDIKRLIKAYPELKELLSDEVKKILSY